MIRDYLVFVVVVAQPDRRRPWFAAFGSRVTFCHHNKLRKKISTKNNNKSSKTVPNPAKPVPSPSVRPGAAATTINGGCYDGWYNAKNTNRSRPSSYGGGVESQTSLAGRRRLLRSTAARRNRREEALNVNNTKSINEKKTEPDWQLFDQLLHYGNHNSPYGAAARVQRW